ncbi:MAG TPA: DUF2279 domain-containing protein [Polyangiaceae bacterium]|nr:DUF2279 domain-containing protein [Polyangiaceae bacterium]
MARWLCSILLGAFCWGRPASAQPKQAPAAPEPSAWLGPSSRLVPEPRPRYVGLIESARSVPLESLGLIALITYTGFKDWNWGSAAFRLSSEGWFGMKTGSGGLDKIGHAYATYMVSELLYWRLRSTHDDDHVVSLYPALFGTALYQYIELFDGYSKDHGYAYEDVIMNTAGVALSLLRNSFPVLRKVLDFRLLYYPSGGRTFQPMIDYEGQKFFGVVKLAGIPGLARTPARYVELLGGFYTRGFPRYADADEKSKHYLLGVGLSLPATILDPLERSHGQPFTFLNLASNYFQSPLYLSTERVRRRPR